MSTIYPRSPRESMAGWVYLPRFVDKIRLHLVGKLAPDYQENFAHRGFDSMWLAAAGLRAEQFIEVVKNTITDGEVCDWVVKNVVRSDAEKEAFNTQARVHGSQSEEMRARLAARKESSGLAQRNDITNFFAYIDADEQRS